jgi:hypothetical protein
VALSEEQKRAMTLGEFEELASRFGAAVSVFKEAQALLGAPVSVTQNAPTPVMPARPPSRLDPEAAAELEAFRASQERARLLAQDPANFPPGIANAMRST